MLPSMIENKKKAFREQIRQKQINSLFETQREKNLSSLRTIQGKKDSTIKKTISEQLTPKIIEDIWNSIIDEEQQCLSQDSINKMIEYCMKNQEHPYHKYVEMILWVLLNECQKNENLASQTCKNIIKMCRELIKLEIKEFNQFIVLLLGNLCGNEQFVRQFIENEGIYTVINLSQAIFDDNSEDLSFLILSILRFFPETELPPEKIRDLSFLFEFIAQKVSQLFTEYYKQFQTRKHKKNHYYYYLNDLSRSLTKIIYIFLQLEYPFIKQQHKFVKNCQNICEKTIKLLSYSQISGIFYDPCFYCSVLSFLSELLSVLHINLSEQNPIFTFKKGIYDRKQNLMKILVFFVKDLNIQINHYEEEEIKANNKVWNIINTISNNSSEFSWKIGNQLTKIIESECCISQQRKILNYLMTFSNEKEKIIRKIEKHIQNKATIINFIQWVQKMKTEAQVEKILEKIEAQYKYDEEIQQILHQVEYS